MLNFKPKFLVERHVVDYEKEWRRIRYHNEMAWPNMFPNILEYLYTSYRRKKE